MKLQTTSSVGVETTVMYECCGELKTAASSLEGFINDLGQLEQDLSNYWEGEDMTMLHEKFSEFKNCLMEMPDVIMSIARWGESTTDAYADTMAKTKQALDGIF